MNRIAQAKETRWVQVSLLLAVLIGSSLTSANAQFPPPEGPPFPPPEGPPCEIRIDVQVDSPNLIPLGLGTTSVAILGCDTIDVTSIDPGSLQLNGVPPVSPELRDVNLDGFLDLVSYFSTADLNLTESTTTVVLTGVIGNTQFIASASITVVSSAVSTSVTLHTVNQPRNPAVCSEGAPACKRSLAGVEVRLFELLSSNALAQQFVSDTHISGCTTDSEGTCFFGAFSAGDYGVIVRWFDPDVGVSVYVGHQVGADDFVDGVAVRHVGLHKTVRNDGTVQYAHAEVVGG